MGLSSLPTPSEGVLTVLVVNTVISIAIMKQIINSILQLVGIRSASPSSSSSPSDLRSEVPENTSEPSLTEKFRSRFKPIRFGRRRCDRQLADCRVCLVRFEPESVVNRLPCGHLFHKGCVEKWLDYNHATCPLCRTNVLPPEEGAGSWPWF